jgi:hypothetical protein
MFPFEFGLSALPCSVFLFAYSSKWFREQLGIARKPAFFLLGCSGIAFLTCWLAPGGHPRYLMPIYPCLGCLAAIALHRITLVQEPAWITKQLWLISRYGVSTGMFIVASGLVLWASGSLPASLGILPVSMTAAIVCAFLILCTLWVFWKTWKPASATLFVASIAFACFLSLTYNAVVISRTQAVCRDMESTIARGRHHIPQGISLVSIGWVQHRFSYHYPEPIKVVPHKQESLLTSDVTWFCMDSAFGKLPELPFDWELVAAIPVDRYERYGPERASVIIGRRRHSPSLTVTSPIAPSSTPTAGGSK